MRYLLLILICSLSCFAADVQYPDPTWSPDWYKAPGYEPIPAGLPKAEIDRQISEYMAKQLKWDKIPVQDLNKKKYPDGIPGEKQREKDQKLKDAAMAINSVISNIEEQTLGFGAAWHDGALIELFKSIGFMRNYRIYYGKIPAFHWQPAK